MCQEIVGTPSKFKFILYKHGPYSFELSECLQGLIADDLIQMQTRPPYGPSSRFRRRLVCLLLMLIRSEGCRDSIRFMSKKLGRKGVAELEKLATATYVNRKFGLDLSLEERARILTSLKSHVPVETARQAFTEVEAIEEEAARQAAA